MNLDFICRPLGQFLLFIYNTISFHNYGLAIIIFTLIIRLVLLPLTLKQYKSSAKMQELQPIIADIQKRYKDDKEKLNQEMMKVYQENNYNPASGCLPLLVQMPILISLYWVIIKPLSFMLNKGAADIDKIVAIAQAGLGAAKKMGFQRELDTLNWFSQNKDALAQTGGLLKRSELIDFNNFIGLHLGETATYHLDKLFGAQAYIYLPLFILVILAVVTTYLSTRLSMPRQQDNASQNAMASSMTNSMMYIGPLMTLMFSFTLPAGVVLYWMVGYVFAIFQQLYINKYVLKRGKKPDEKAIEAKKPEVAEKTKQIGTASGNANKKTNAVANTGNKGKGNTSGNKGKNSGKK
jgi:YidC/Oxa1 family membrane protein insertase